MAINFPIVTTFDDKAIKKADDAFTKLGKTFIGLFSVQKVYAFGKASVQAFAQSQKEAQLLATQLNAVNLGFASPYLNDFIDKLALATGKTGGELTSAFVALSQATGDATTAQKILTTALDVSLGTGKDLQTVANALQRAYKGETTALAKLRIGYTTAELKGKKFDDVLADLQKRFSGAASDAVDTFAGKMARLNEAVDQAKEKLGEGLVKGLEDSKISIEELQQKIIDTGEALGQLSADVVKFVDKTIAAFDRLANSAPVKFLAKLIELLGRYVLEPIVMGGGFGGSFNAGDAKRAMDASRTANEQNRAALRAQNALTKAESKAAAAKLAATKKQADAEKKKNRENAILNDLQKRFDMERIQIQAALGGKINEVERLRLELMQAILDEDVKRAIILEGQLIKAESAAAELALLLDSLDELVGDPFADWPATIARIQTLLKQLNIKIPIETLFAEKGLKLDQEKMTVTKLERMDVNANNVYVNGMLNGVVTNPVMPGTSDGKALGDLPPNWESIPVIAAAVNAAADADALAAESAAALALLEAEAAAAALAQYEADQALKALFAQLGLDEFGNPINVIVNVEGSIIGEGDLVEKITDEIYRIQKTGKRITLSAIGI